MGQVDNYTNVSWVAGEHGVEVTHRLYRMIPSSMPAHFFHFTYPCLQSVSFPLLHEVIAISAFHLLHVSVWAICTVFYDECKYASYVYDDTSIPRLWCKYTEWNRLFFAMCHVLEFHWDWSIHRKHIFLFWWSVLPLPIRFMRMVWGHNTWYMLNFIAERKYIILQVRHVQRYWNGIKRIWSFWHQTSYSRSHPSLTLLC